ncbi:hypothetical protein BGW36DRAFT_371031 [Talaromyces proteolyticus]|uniref:Secreted protein n=1 Tax=Talaromyces proteolyticus TaxID=1131652 RepID=A0AAD4Q0N1_9EURO|nr:uncharacterized protein BGW36DRAFT_371031 [Talaromyces proteolyticus]KAH8704283.1 hypothetical protein BGW36DRAFT_371031 [Talaromyces proteolyticus]
MWNGRGLMGQACSPCSLLAIFALEMPATCQAAICAAICTAICTATHTMPSIFFTLSRVSTSREMYVSEVDCSLHLIMLASLASKRDVTGQDKVGQATCVVPDSNTPLELA